jgi:hypothetical protein
MACVVVCSVAELFAKEPLLILRKSGKDFDEVVKGMSEELTEEFTITQVTIDKEADVALIREKMGQVRPRVAVLLDNQSISLFKKYQAEQPDSVTPIPSISLMGILIERLMVGMKNATGVSYEIPIVTSAVNMRSVLNVKLERIGVIHREFMSEFIEKQRKYCEKENIKVVSYVLPNKDDDYTGLIKKGLKQLVKKDGIQALWVPNDNSLLTPATIRDVWVPMVKDSKIPVIVGVEVLVNPALNFGTFAVLPDHVAMGTQAAEIIYDIMDNDWNTSNRQIEPPLSVYKIVNLVQAKNYFNVKDENLRNVDRVAK